MNIRNIKIFILIAISSTGLLAADNNLINPFNLSESNPDYLNVNDEWLSANRKENTPAFTLKTNNNVDFGSEIEMAWNLSKSIIINFSLFENSLNPDISIENKPTPYSYKKSFSSKSIRNFSNNYETPSLETNRNISGYKLGISSKFGMGKNTILNINFNYGQLNDENLIGFDKPEINTGSFALGFRKAKFGASLLTDTYLEDNVDMVENTRLGFELDWYFSNDTTISFGSKQRLNSNQSNIKSSLDTVTGDVQYIKFQHNL